VTDDVQLGDLQLAIMRVLWDRGEATVAHVHEVLLPSRGLALTTIATMLRKMEDKGVVAHRNAPGGGRQFIYEPTVKERDVSRSMVAQLAERVFEGDMAAMLNHLISDHEIDRDDLARLKRLIAKKQREMEGERGG
jgi:predicted transcriptional regulator